MTYEFKYLMRILGYVSVKAEIPEPEQPIDWDKLSSLASFQSVYPMLAFALGLTKNSFISDDLRSQMEKSARQAAIIELSRRLNAQKLLSDMEQQGINVAMIKGFALADCYASPEIRISGDVDLLINKTQEHKALRFLNDCCIDMQKREKGEHHSVFRHASIGIIEVHVLLYDEFIEDIWYKKLPKRAFISEPYIRIDDDAGSYYTLGKTDHMIFLALHLVKHFILSGMCLRMMLDVTLFYVKNHNEVDKERFWDIIKSLQYEMMLCNVIGAVIRYCGMPLSWLELLPVKPEESAMSMILDDLETGGFLGLSDKKNRNDGWHAYTRLRSEKLHSNRWYRFYMKRRAILPALFPPRAHLENTYPSLVKHSYLIGFFWLHRLLVRGGRRLLRNDIHANIVENEDEISQVGQERMEMFRKLDMI